MAFAIKYRNEMKVCLCFMGDGATNIGAFHEGLNLAGLWKLPVIFIIENNKYGMGTAVDRASAISELHKKALAYNIYNEVVDGMDVLEVYKKVKAVADRAKETYEPALLEIETYRFRGHSMSDPIHGHYRSKEEVERLKRSDPITMFGETLKEEGIATDQDFEDAEKRIKAIVEQCVEFTENSPEPPNAVNKKLQVRAGYNYGKSPIPHNMVTFNLLAPASTEHHYTLGFTYRANDNLEVTGTYLYAASNSQSACGQNIVDCASFNMHQNVFGLTMGWVLDPGPVALGEYGEDDWAGINFDGWHAGFGIGQSMYQDVDSSLDSALAAEGMTSSTSGDDTSVGWKVYLGYQFNKYLGVEGGYVNLNDMTLTSTITAPVAGSARTNAASDGWTLAAVGMPTPICAP